MESNTLDSQGPSKWKWTLVEDLKLVEASVVYHHEREGNPKSKFKPSVRDQLLKRVYLVPLLGVLWSHQLFLYYKKKKNYKKYKSVWLNNVDFSLIQIFTIYRKKLHGFGPNYNLRNYKAVCPSHSLSINKKLLYEPKI